MTSAVDYYARGYIGFCGSRGHGTQTVHDSDPFVWALDAVNVLSEKYPLLAIEVFARVVEIEPDGFAAQQIAVSGLVTVLNALQNDQTQYGLKAIKDSKGLMRHLPNIWIEGLEENGMELLGQLRLN